MRRVFVAIGMIASLAALVAAITAGWSRGTLRAGQVYNVPVRGQTAAFDLPLADPDEQYLLVVSNVGWDTPQAGRIELRSVGTGEVGALSLRTAPQPPYRPLVVKIPRAASTPAAATRGSPASRDFWLHVAEGAAENPAGYRRIRTRLAGEGKSVRVWVDRDDLVPADTIEAIVDLYDRSVLPTTRRWLGAPPDVDGDGKFSIVLTGWLGRLEGGRASLGGMVWPSDFRNDLATPFSNGADVLYLNAAQRPGRHLETLLAHELAHAVTVGARLRQGAWLPAAQEESWLNEAIAHVAENLQSENFSNLDYRIAAFLAEPELTPLVVSNYASRGLWREAAPRGGTYLFLRWLVDRYGPGLLSRLVHSSRSGTANIEAATGARFDELYRQFAVEMFLPSASSQGDSKNGWRVPLPAPDLHAGVGDFPLAGPRYESWSVDEPVGPARALAGGGSAYFLLSSRTAGPRRVTVCGKDDIRLQVTLVRLPEDLSRTTVGHQGTSPPARDLTARQ